MFIFRWIKKVFEMLKNKKKLSPEKRSHGVPECKGCNTEEKHDLIESKQAAVKEQEQVLDGVPEHSVDPLCDNAVLSEDAAEEENREAGEPMMTGSTPENAVVSTEDEKDYACTTDDEEPPVVFEQPENESFAGESAEEQETSPAETTDVPNDYASGHYEENTSVFFDESDQQKENENAHTKTSGNYSVLLQKECRSWPLRRLLVFGVPQNVIVSMCTEDADDFSLLSSGDTFGMMEEKWLSALSEEEFNGTYRMCLSWQELLDKHTVASKIEHYRAGGFSDSQIMTKFGISVEETESLCKAFASDIVSWLNKNHPAFRCLYSDNLVEENKAAFYFGKLTFGIVKKAVENAKNFSCVWVAYKELPCIVYDPQMNVNKFSLTVICEDAVRKGKKSSSFYEVLAWFENELQKRNIHVLAEPVLRCYFGAKGIACTETKHFGKEITQPHVLKGNRTQEQATAHAPAQNWDELAAWLKRQFVIQPMLGSIELYEEEYALMLEDMSKRIKSLRSREEEEPVNPLLCIELVQFAIRESKSGALWTKLGRFLGCKNTDPVMQWLGNLFIRTMKRYQKAVYEAGEKVASILMHCFVCNPHISDFFDFLYAYYRLDMMRDMEQMDIAALRERMVNKQPYSYGQLILQQTLDAMTYLPEIGIQRFEKYIRWINEAFWNVAWKPEEEDRFARAFQIWRSNNPDFDGKIHNYVRLFGKSKHYFSKPFIELDLRSGSFEIVLPVQKIRFETDEPVCWRIQTDGTSVVPCELTEAVTCYHTEESRISLPENVLLDEMTFELLTGETVKRTYSIAADCYRAFDEKGHMISDVHFAMGRAYVFTAPENKMVTAVSALQQRHGSWLLSIYDFSEGDIVSLPDGTVTVVGSEQAEGPCGVKPLEGSYALSDDGIRLPIYSSLPYLLIQTLPERFKNGRLLLNGTYLELSKLASVQYDVKNRTEENCWLISLPPSEDNLYRIQVDIPGEKNQRVWQFACVPELQYCFEGELPYWNRTTGSIRIECGEPLTAVNQKQDEQTGCYLFAIEPDKRELCYILSSGMKLYIEIPLLLWRIPDGPWNVEAPGDLWYTDFPDMLEFSVPEKRITLSVDDETASDKQRCITAACTQKDAAVPFDTITLRSWFTRKHIRHTVYVTVDDKHYVFAQVYRATHLDSAVFTPDYDNNCIRACADLTGQGVYYVELSQGENSLSGKKRLLDGKASIQGIPNPGMYKASVWEAETDEFGFGETYFLLGSYDLELKDPGDISGMSCYLKEIVTSGDNPETLPLPYKYYWLDIQERDPNNPKRYIAYLRENDDFAKLFGRSHSTPVYVMLTSLTNIRSIRILYYADPIPRPFMYEPKFHRLVKRGSSGEDAVKLDSLDIYHVKYVEKV